MIDPLDISSAVSFLDDNVGVSLVLIGIALISSAALSVAVRWVRRAIFDDSFSKDFPRMSAYEEKQYMDYVKKQQGWKD